MECYISLEMNIARYKGGMREYEGLNEGAGPRPDRPRGRETGRLTRCGSFITSDAFSVFPRTCFLFLFFFYISYTRVYRGRLARPS